MSNDKTKHEINVQIEYRQDLSQVTFDVLSVDGTPLTAQAILDAIAETLLLKYDNYDLEAVPDYDS